MLINASVPACVLATSILLVWLLGLRLGTWARAECCLLFTFQALSLHSHVKRFVCFKKAFAVIEKECIKSGVNKLNWCEGLIGLGGEV